MEQVTPTTVLIAMIGATATVMGTIFWYFIQKLIEILHRTDERISKLENLQGIMLSDNEHRDEKISTNRAKIERLERTNREDVEQIADLIFAKIKAITPH